jgi:hypothetical protein
MCRNCFSKGTAGFATWQDYESLSQVLQEKCTAGQMSVVAKPKSSANDFAEAYYQCSSCKEIWALSSPENAWRGYFLPLKTAVTYMRQIEFSDRVRGIVGLVVIVAALLFLLWKMIQ